MHGLKLPFTGMTVGGVAAAVLIAVAAHERGLYQLDPQARVVGKRTARLLLEVTSTVLLIKALASPHSPVTAYVAVAFQGLAAAALFRWIPSFRWAAILFATLAMAESATQKLLMMVLVYGHAFLDALDALTAYATGQIAAIGIELPLSGKAILALFLGTYTLWGALLGWTVSLWPARAQTLRDGLLTDWHNIPLAAPTASQKRRKIPALGLIVIVGTLAAAGASSDELGWLVVRTLLITTALFGLVGPALRYVLKRRASEANRGLALTLIGTFDDQRRRFVWAMQRARRTHPFWKLPFVGLEYWILLNLILPPDAD